MELLESAMAFAVVMMIFSTIVTGIVEAILKAFGTREEVLKKTIEALYEKVVWPRLSAGIERVSPQQLASTVDDGILAKSKAWLTRSSTNLPTHKEKFVEALTENPVFEPSKNRFSAERKSKIDSLSLLAFAERLGRTDVGKAIVAEGEAQVELLVQDMVRSFDRFGRAASEVFRKKAQLTAICVAIPFAWFANIDASRLFVQLIENPSIRSSLIENADEEHKQNQAAVVRLDQLKNDIAKLQAPPNTLTPTGPAPTPGMLQQQLDDISKQVLESVEKMESQGLAIGWQYYPVCAKGQKDAACDGRVGWMDKQGKEQGVFDIALTSEFAVWLLMSSLAGVLIGFGGPFWFKVFSGLSQIFQVMRALTFGGRKPAKEDLPPPDTIAESSAKPKDVLDAFKVAVAVNMKS
ncbi:hypothetical protein [Neptunomonas sp.]|uniref:hypothetical protein n=1 Tax=Neptunomonas sp. TaxID=1971898 RepID=UPI003564B928